MPTTEQMIMAASQPISFERMSKALDVFIPAAFGDVEDICSIATKLPSNPINNGLIATTAALQKSGWREAEVAVMGIRIYRAFLALQGMAPLSCLFVKKHPRGGAKLDDRLIRMIAETPMRFDPEKGMVVFDTNWLRSALQGAANDEKKTPNPC